MGDLSGGGVGRIGSIGGGRGMRGKLASISSASKWKLSLLPSRPMVELGEYSDLNVPLWPSVARRRRAGRR